MARKWVAVAAVAALALAGARGAEAQVGQLTSNASVSISIPTVLFISTSGNFTYGQPGVTDYDAGAIDASNTITVVHAGNVKHDVQVQAAADTMSYSGSATPPGKPVTDLQVSVDGGSNWTPVAKSSTTALTGSEGLLVNSAARGVHTRTASSRIALAYANDPPGSYGANFTFTIVVD